MPTRLLLVDDHGLVRSGLRQMITSLLTDVDIIAEADNGHDALRLIGRSDVDILVTDLSMPDLDGIGLIRAALKKRPKLKCMVISMHTDKQYVVAAFKAGACAYLHKDANSEDLLLAFEAARSGGNYLHPNIAPSVVELLRETETALDPIDQLSPRQRQVLIMYVEGSSTRQIAERLNLSVKTIETHRAQIMERLNVRDLPALVRIAIRHGLVGL